MRKKSIPQLQAEQLDRQLDYWEANAKKNAAEQAEIRKLRAAGKMPSVVDRFDVAQYQKKVMQFNQQAGRNTP